MSEHVLIIVVIFVQFVLLSIWLIGVQMSIQKIIIELEKLHVK